MHKSLNVYVTGVDGFEETDSIFLTHTIHGNSTQSTPTVVGNNNFVSPLSQYLTFPTLPAATNAKPNKKLPMACLLTNNQYLAELEEKEHSKQLVVEEKEWKKKIEKKSETKKRF